MLTLNGNDVLGSSSAVVSPIEDTTYELIASNANGSVSRTVVVRMTEPGVPIISEFLTSNNDGLTDEEGMNSDWIELFNPSPVVASLAGYYLTDDATDLRKWAFPDVTLADSIRESLSKAWRSWGARMLGRERSSGASALIVWYPAASASSLIRSSRTVLPTPRRPIIRTDLAVRPIAMRSMAMRTCSRSSSRPASSGGWVPAPGGIRISKRSYQIYPNLPKKDKLE